LSLTIFEREYFMHTFAYPAKFSEDKDDGGYTVTFRDLPESITQGNTIDECMVEAKDCLDEAIAGRMDDREEIPIPSKMRKTEHLIILPVTSAVKASLYIKMKEKQFSNTKLAKLLDVDEKEVRRMLDPHHGTKIPAMERALSVLGGKVKVVL